VNIQQLIDQRGDKGGFAAAAKPVTARRNGGQRRGSPAH
jgi:hypothetical protein